MATHVGRVGVVGNDPLRRYNLLNEEYLMQDRITTTELTPYLVPYSGWASYKNVKSGQYNRRLCWNCHSAKSFPQAVGVYPLNVAETPPWQTTSEYVQGANAKYEDYQKHRMCNNPGVVGSGHSNWHNKERYNLYPKEYVKGWWPDEQGEVTTLRGSLVTSPCSVGECVMELRSITHNKKM